MPRGVTATGDFDVDGVVAKVGQLEVPQTADRRSHADSRPCAARPSGANAASSREATRRPRRTARPAGRSEATIPGSKVLGFARTSANGTWCDRQRSLRRMAVDRPGAGPALGRAQDDHGPMRPRRSGRRARVVLDVLNLVEHAVKGRGHRLVHRGRVVSPSTKRGASP